MSAQWLKYLWLEAQGIPTHYIWRWENPDLFEVYPPHCVVCGRAWRPDEPHYIALYGVTRTPEGTRHGSEWYSPALGIVASTELVWGQMQIRYLCHEHGDRWPTVMDCVTGEEVALILPPTRLQRAWRDALYWSSSVLRFLWLLASPLWDRDPSVRHAPWPPLRVM